MNCPQCNKVMKVLPYLSISNPPQDEYKCECGHIVFVNIGGDMPLNGGYICRKHDIGYIGECPSCAFERKYLKDNRE